jgi:hypothetical protein
MTVRAAARRRLAAAAALTLVSFCQVASAQPSKAECVAAHEQGQRLWKADRLVQAVELLARCASDTCPPLVASECGAFLVAAISELPSVIVQAASSDGRLLELREVFIDQTPIQGSGPKTLDPGEHTASVVTTDGLRASTRFIVRRGERDRRVVLEVALPPAPAAAASSPVTPAPAPAPGTVPAAPLREGGTRLAPNAAPYAWGLAALSAVAIGTFAVYGLSGRAKERDLQRTCAPFCDSGSVDSMHRDYVVADVSLGVGLVAAGLSLWVFHAFRAPASRQPAALRAPLSWQF